MTYHRSHNEHLFVEDGDIVIGSDNRIVYMGPATGKLTVAGSRNHISGKQLGLLCIEGGDFNKIDLVVEKLIVGDSFNKTVDRGMAIQEPAIYGHHNEISRREEKALMPTVTTAELAWSGASDEVVYGTTVISDLGRDDHLVALDTSANSTSIPIMGMTFPTTHMHCETPYPPWIGAAASDTTSQSNCAGSASSIWRNPVERRAHSPPAASSSSSSSSSIPESLNVAFLKPANLSTNSDVATSEECPDKDTCQICFERYRQLMFIPCGHVFACIKCTYDYIDQSMQSKGEAPINGACTSSSSDDRASHVPCPVCKAKCTQVIRAIFN